MINKRNFQKQILDFGMRISDLRYSVHFKLIERSESTIRHSTFVIRHSKVVSKERQPLAASGQSDQRKETNERRTSNVQHRTSNNVFYLLKKTERSESIIRHSTFDIRHSNVVSQERLRSTIDNRIQGQFKFPVIGFYIMKLPHMGFRGSAHLAAQIIVDQQAFDGTHERL